MSDIAKRSTIYLCMRKSAIKELMDTLLFAAGGYSGISAGGGGSNNDLTKWQVAKKRNGWGIGLFTFKRNYANTHFDLPKSVC
jgi:hypothetical protein